MTTPTRITESAPMSVADFLRRMDNWKLATALIKDDPASALRTIQTLKAEQDELLALVRNMLPELAEYANATGCDHEVGLCACDLNRLVAHARALLARLDGPVTP